jgi:hypothetical protein
MACLLKNDPIRRVYVPIGQQAERGAGSLDGAERWRGVASGSPGLQEMRESSGLTHHPK